MNETQIKKKAYNDGYAKGYDEGFASMEEFHKAEVARLNLAVASPHLRDYFAAKAMQFELTKHRDAMTDPDCDFYSWEDVQDYVADCAYTMADAMLKRRAE